MVLQGLPQLLSATPHKLTRCGQLVPKRRKKPSTAVTASMLVVVALKLYFDYGSAVLMHQAVTQLTCYGIALCTRSRGSWHSNKALQELVLWKCGLRALQMLLPPTILGARNHSVQSVKVEAKLNNFLLYDKDCHFTNHVDRKRYPQHFGTLVIQLP